MKALAACMKEQGKYAVYVGSLTVPLHITWSDSAINYQKQHYPNMQLVGDKFGVGESLDDSVRTTNDLMAKYPDLKGVLAFGSQGPIGAGRAVLNRGKSNDICVIGPFSRARALRWSTVAPSRVAISGIRWWRAKCSCASPT